MDLALHDFFVALVLYYFVAVLALRFYLLAVARFVCLFDYPVADLDYFYSVAVFVADCPFPYPFFYDWFFLNFLGLFALQHPHR